MKMAPKLFIRKFTFFPKKKMKKKCVYVYTQKCAGFYYIIYKRN